MYRASISIRVGNARRLARLLPCLPPINQVASHLSAPAPSACDGRVVGQFAVMPRVRPSHVRPSVRPSSVCPLSAHRHWPRHVVALRH